MACGMGCGGLARLKRSVSVRTYGYVNVNFYDVIMMTFGLARRNAMLRRRPASRACCLLPPASFFINLLELAGPLV